jgi:catechol 2,3-dioxygenase-like lactoylglutathione lyase family enzyme
MIDHVSIGVSDLERSARFYEATLATLGLARLVTRPATIGFGRS